MGMLSVFGAVGAFVYAYHHTTIPDPNSAYQTQTTKIFYADGTTELGTFANQNRESIPYAQMPHAIKDAVVAAENRTFWTDRGLDLRGIARAAVNNVRGGPTQGASTITQQYVKILYLTQERTFSRKAKEALVSLKLHREKSKQQILEGYLNTVYFGRGAYGIEAAAQAFFARPARHLNLRQCAVLASMLNSPTSLDPISGGDSEARLEERYDYVLASMEATSAITADEAADARRALPRFPEIRPVSQYGGQKGHMLRLVREELLRLGYSDAAIEGGGLRVTTTVTPEAMTAAAASTKATRPAGFGPELHMAVASIEPQTGALRGFYAGQDFLKSEINWAATGSSAGSTFHVFAVASALQEGHSLGDTFDGTSPYLLPDGVHKIENSRGRSFGRRVPMLKAMTASVNTALVDLSLSVEHGPRKVVATANALGIPAAEGSAFGIPRHSPGLEANPTVALGSTMVSPINLASAYGAIANGGVAAPVHIIERVESVSSQPSYQQQSRSRRAVDPEVAWSLSGALMETFRSKAGTMAAGALLAQPVGGIGGTGTNRAGEISTAWYVGYAPRLSTAVMYARGDGDESLSARSPGRRLADHPARTWFAVMERLTPGPESATRIGSSVGPALPAQVSASHPARSKPAAGPARGRKSYGPEDAGSESSQPTDSGPTPCEDSSTALIEMERPHGWAGSARVRFSHDCGVGWASYVDPTLPNCGLPAVRIQLGVRVPDGAVDPVSGHTMHSDLCRFGTAKLPMSPANYARLRVGSYYCAAGSCDYSWGPWSRWVGS
jgi:membrane peptidoglycan carboxypeptidase